jgi:integrase
MLEDLQIRNYSPTTVRIYLHCVKAFAQHFGSAPDRLGPEHIRQYQLFLVKEKQVSLPTYIQTVCALRFLYSHTISRKIAIEKIPFPRRARKLPHILSHEEVKVLLEAPRTLLDRVLLATLYGAGLRVSEVIHLKVADIDSRRSVLWVRQGKGRKDRQTLLPPKLLDLLRAYWRAERPSTPQLQGFRSDPQLVQAHSGSGGTLASIAPLMNLEPRSRSAHLTFGRREFRDPEPAGAALSENGTRIVLTVQLQAATLTRCKPKPPS